VFSCIGNRPDKGPFIFFNKSLQYRRIILKYETFQIRQRMAYKSLFLWGLRTSGNGMQRRLVVGNIPKQRRPQPRCSRGLISRYLFS
jgi:hypothetical protein